MFKYLYTGDSPQVIPSLGIEVEPGATVEVDEPINHPDFKPISEEKSKKKGVDE